MCEGGGRGGEGGGRAIGRAIDLKMPLENGRADERVSRGQASERSVCVWGAVSVENGARRPPLPAAVVCPPGGRRRRRLAITADIVRGLLGRDTVTSRRGCSIREDESIREDAVFDLCVLLLQDLACVYYCRTS